LVRTLVDLTRHGLDRDHLRVVLNGAPRTPSRQASAGRTVRRLLAEVDGGTWSSPASLPHERGVEACVRDARPLPTRFVRRVGRIVEAAP
jgi:hypothetical protein